MSLLILRLYVDGVESDLKAQRNWSAEKLYEEVADVTNSKLESFDLHAFGRLVERNRSMLMLNFVANDKIEFRRRLQQLTPLRGFIELTTEPCSMTGDDDPMVKRAKIFCCGCVLSAEGMDLMCQTKLDEGVSMFKCPSCGKPWEFFVVRHVLSAVKSAQEIGDISSRVNANFEKNPLKDIRRCPSCKTWSTRESPETWVVDPNRVICNVCTKKLGRTFEFCWSCEHEWTGGESCGNDSCLGATAQLKELARCGTKEMFGVKECPEIRACPRCGMLMSHIDYCKIMTCPTCKIKFCFICLRIADRYPKAPCASDENPYGPCKVAARQTRLPNNWKPDLAQ